MKHKVNRIHFHKIVAMTMVGLPSSSGHQQGIGRGRAAISSWGTPEEGGMELGEDRDTSGV